MLQTIGANIREAYRLILQQKKHPDNPKYKDDESRFFMLLGDKTERPFHVDLSSDWHSPDLPWECLEIDSSASIEKILEAFYQKTHELRTLWIGGCTGERPCNRCDYHFDRKCDVWSVFDCDVPCGKCKHCQTFSGFYPYNEYEDFPQSDLLEEACDYMISSILDELQVDVRLKIPIENLLKYRPISNKTEIVNSNNAMIFIDGQNLRGAFSEDYKDHQHRVGPEDVVPVIERDLKELIPNTKIYQVHYFDGVKDEKHEKFFQALQHLPLFKVHPIKEYTRKKDGIKTTDVDEPLIDCVLQTITRFKLDTIVLVTGDEDYIELAQQLQKEKNTVVVAYPENSPSLNSFLKNQADYLIDLSELGINPKKPRKSRTRVKTSVSKV